MWHVHLADLGRSGHTCISLGSIAVRFGCSSMWKNATEGRFGGVILKLCFQKLDSTLVEKLCAASRAAKLCNTSIGTTK